MEHAVPRRSQAPSPQSGAGARLSRYALVGAGGLLALQGVRRGGMPGAAMAVAGAGMVLAGSAGPRTVPDAGRALLAAAPKWPAEAVRAITIGRPRRAVFDFWRDYSNLAGIVPELEQVVLLDGGRSEWKARLPTGLLVTWTAETLEERPGEFIAWRTVGSPPFPHHGRVEFRDAPGGRGTEVAVAIRYRAPFGRAGRAAAWLAGPEPARQLTEGLRRLKQVLEVDDVATVSGQSHGRRGFWRSGTE